MFYYFNKGKNTTETHKTDLCSVWRRCCDWSNVSKWFDKFHAGDFSLDDDPGSGRPVKIDSDQIKTLNENSQMLYHVGDSWHAQNIQINKVIGENEKCVFYFMGKN